MSKTDTAHEKPIGKHTQPRKVVVSRAVEDKIFQQYLEISNDILAYLICMLRDIYHLSRLSFTDYSMDEATLIRRFNHEGLSFATQTLPTLFNCLLQYIETGKSSYPGFKLDPGRKHPAFLRQLFRRIYQVSETRVNDIRMLYQFCVAFKKLKGPYRQSVLRKELREFVDTDIELRYLDFKTEATKPILEEARRYCKEILKGLSIEDQPALFVPRPGPGATNTPRRNHERFRPHVMYTKLNEIFPYEEWFYTPNPWDLVVERSRFMRLTKREAPTSRFKFVNKTFSKPRGICIEELETQWLQQAVKKALYETMECHPETRGHINFRDQSINGELALRSSKDRRYATIDMKAASDRISRELVSYLFQDNRELHDAIMALSVEIIELPDEINFIKRFPCAKYAPMGSALCFPVMSLVHYSLCRAIIRQSQASHSDSKDIFVYGDDIIVPSHCAQAIYDWLPQFGMKINTEKSYVRSSFRESCGVHAYEGEEITPAYFRSVPRNSSRNDVLISSLILEGKLFKRGFHETARHLRLALRKVKRFKVGLLPYVRPESPILGWIRDDCEAPLFRHHICFKERYHADLQQRQYKVRVLKPRLERLPPLPEVEGYLRKLVTLAENAKDVSGSCVDLLIQHMWLPESAF